MKWKLASVMTLNNDDNWWRHEFVFITGMYFPESDCWWFGGSGQDFIKTHGGDGCTPVHEHKSTPSSLSLSHYNYLCAKVKLSKFFKNFLGQLGNISKILKKSLYQINRVVNSSRWIASKLWHQITHRKLRWYSPCNIPWGFIPTYPISTVFRLLIGPFWWHREN